jgi:hypothetical protein
MGAKMDSFNTAVQNQLSFNRMLETQIQQLSAALNPGGETSDPPKESVNCIHAVLKGENSDSECSWEVSEGTEDEINRKDGIIPISDLSSHVVLNRLKSQFGGLEQPTIPCVIGLLKIHHALCDWGAGVNIMPKSIYDCIDEDPLVPASQFLQLADGTVIRPHGIAEHVLVEIRGSTVLVDFYVIDMDHRQPSCIILGSPFLGSVKADINEKTGDIKLDVDGRKENFAFCPKRPDCCDQVRVYFKKGSNVIDHVEVVPCSVHGNKGQRTKRMCRRNKWRSRRRSDRLAAQALDATSEVQPSPTTPA